MLGAPLRTVAADAPHPQRTRHQLQPARRPKDAHELALLRRAAAATAAGYAQLPGLIRPGVTERALQIELEAGFFRHGATRPGYGSIVGSGPNAAVLHFEPSARAARAGEFVLVDPGGEIDRYVTDVTRTYVVGEPSSFQRDLYHVVLAAEERAIVRCVPGARWKNSHLAAAVDRGGGLVAMGVMRGTPESLAEQEAHTLFFPMVSAIASASTCATAAARCPAEPKTRSPASARCAWTCPSPPATSSPPNPASISSLPCSTIPLAGPVSATP